MSGMGKERIVYIRSIITGEDIWNDTGDKTYSNDEFYNLLVDLDVDKVLIR
ncbi:MULTISPECIES: BTA121 domain-containing protein surface lipoprotein [Borrelia]|nr:hypothetical protein [Borrelia recurrentis]